MPQHKELATACLQLVNQAKVSASDNDLALALTIRGWLGEIAAGTLVVDKAVEAPELKAA